MTRLETLLNKRFEELTNEELVELKTLLVKSDIEVDVIDAETFETVKEFFKEDDTMMNENTRDCCVISMFVQIKRVKHWCALLSMAPSCPMKRSLCSTSEQPARRRWVW